MRARSGVDCFFKSFFLLLVGLVGFSTALSAGTATEACTTSAAQASCMVTCAKVCQSDPVFLTNNSEYCLSNNLLVRDLVAEGITDAPFCTQFSETNSPPPEGGETDLTNGQSPPIEVGGLDCSKIKDGIKKAQCILNEQRRKGEIPSCSPSTPVLTQRARLLDDNITAELDRYGDLLTRDFTEVKNQKALCDMSLDQLNAFYKVSTQDTGSIETLQAQARSIVQCSKEWGDYLSRVPVGGNDILSASLADTVRADLEFLGPKMGELGTSLLRLRKAEPTLLSLLQLHILNCPATPDN